jgi:glycosyltransferase involved in cell wall biosynthesis
MAPYFSVILPTYNRARMARTALKTVLSQDFADWECLVVDDGSTDDTAAVLNEFASDPRVVVIRSPRNQGMNASRNLALARASGRFATFLDSDDLWLPSRLSAFRARAERSPDAGFIFSNAYVHRYDRLIGLLFDPRRSIPEGRVPGYYAVGDRELPYVTTNVALSRDAFTRLGLFKIEMKTLDTELFARFLASGLPVAVIMEPLSVRRIHGAQLTDRYTENYRESLIALDSSGAEPATKGRLRREFALEVALYLVKAARPDEARAFLDAELGDAARGERVDVLARLPAALLSAAEAARRLWLTVRHHPAFASAEEREVYRLIDPLLAEETR